MTRAAARKQLPPSGRAQHETELAAVMACGFRWILLASLGWAGEPAFIMRKIAVHEIVPPLAAMLSFGEQ